MDKLSYALGALIGTQLTQMGASKEVAISDFAQGVEDVLQQNEWKIDSKEAQQIVQAYFAEIEDKRSKGAKEDGKKFLADNAKKAEVKTTPSGLQYEVLTEGTGAKPKASDRVKVHYEGSLIDGTVFDSSVKRGQPAVFGVTQVIQGWVEALQMMTEGSKWRLYIPSELGYGANGAGESIPPHSTLIFDVELLEIQ